MKSPIFFSLWNTWHKFKSKNNSYPPPSHFKVINIPLLTSSLPPPLFDISLTEIHLMFIFLCHTRIHFAFVIILKCHSFLNSRQHFPWKYRSPFNNQTRMRIIRRRRRDATVNLVSLVTIHSHPSRYRYPSWRAGIKKKDLKLKKKLLPLYVRDGKYLCKSMHS